MAKDDLGDVLNRLYVKHNTELKKIRVADIEFGERFRQNYGNLDELSSSILANGLISPITVKHLEQPVNGKHYLLIAGGRRFTCYMLLFQTHGNDFAWISANVYPHTIEEEQLRVMELCENMHRKEMTWLEEVNIKLRVHRSLQSKHGTARTSSLGGHSLRDTAALFGISHSTLSVELRLAEIAEYNETMRLCTSKAEAQRLYESIQKALEREEKAAVMLKDITSSKEELTKMKSLTAEEKASLPPEMLAEIENAEKSFIHRRLKTLDPCFILHDAFEFIRTRQSEYYDLIELDPPYAIDYVAVRKGADSAESEGYIELTKERYMEQMLPLLKESYRILKEDGWLLFWHAITPFNHVLFEELLKIGFQGRMQPAIWVKPTGQTNNPKYHLGSAYEGFWYLRKGKAAIAKPQNNIFFFPTIPASQRVHITEKPIEMLTEILATFVPKYANIYVPFLGSGNTILAAWNLSVKAEGCDLTEDHKRGYLLKVMDRNMLECFSSYKKKEESSDGADSTNVKST